MPDVRLKERVIRLGRQLEAPTLSVLTPFHRDDPTPLLKRLEGAPDGVEFVLLDDGSGSAHLLADVLSHAEKLGAPARIVVLERNGGRAAGRNRLIAEARGEYVLFLDADMLPDSDEFLANWLDVIKRQRPFAAFGGLSVRQSKATPETAFHLDLFERSDCHSARTRAQSPARYTAAANLLVRRDVFAQIQFDDSFSGWGWEDVDWALRAARHAPILHIDNSATHAGLDSVETLMRKSREAGPNFARLAAKHPNEITRYPAFRMANALKRAPALTALRAAFSWLARDPLEASPMPLRRVAFKLYRASHYAEHLA
ncbi:glycosyl transferase family protein [alpha proteobacterium U9-1i]|nr:glycosyl transferase family protein [alpha proteobacterium U9-1i]